MTGSLAPLTPAQITASRDRLLSEGFHLTSKAIRVHDELLAAREINDRNVEGAVQSMDELIAECERRGDRIERLRAVIERLLTLKNHKDRSGKSLWYEREQPKAWDAARQELAGSVPPAEREDA